jgi:hypothetical protein
MLQQTQQHDDKSRPAMYHGRPINNNQTLVAIRPGTAINHNETLVAVPAGQSVNHNQAHGPCPGAQTAAAVIRDQVGAGVLSVVLGAATPL